MDRDSVPAQVEQLFRLYYPRIFAYEYRRTRNFHLAEDLAQQVFVNALVSSGKFPERKVVQWLYTIAHNLLVSYYRKSSKITETPLEEAQELVSGEGDAEGLVIKEEELIKLRSALEKLNLSQQTVLKLRYGCCLSIQDTAFLLDRSISWVKIIQHRALLSLRKLAA